MLRDQPYVRLAPAGGKNMADQSGVFFICNSEIRRDISPPVSLPCRAERIIIKLQKPVPVKQTAATAFDDICILRPMYERNKKKTVKNAFSCFKPAIFCLYN